MGLVLQVNYLFTGTVMENIRYAKPDATDEQVIAAAQEIGSHDAIMALKDGFQTEVGERGAQHVPRPAAADLLHPRLPGRPAHLHARRGDQRRRHRRPNCSCSGRLEKLLAGRTTFVVAHRLSTIMKADMILVIDAGRIIERGTHRELVGAGGKYAHLYEQFVAHGSADGAAE